MENVENRIWKHMSFDIDINPVKKPLLYVYIWKCYMGIKGDNICGYIFNSETEHL